MRTDQGIIKEIIIIVIALIVLGYFGFNVQNIINSPTVHNNLTYVWNLIVTFWNTYLQASFSYVWNNIIIGIVWNQLLHPGFVKLGVA